MTDTELIALLEGDPEAGMAAVIEQYSGLLWKVASNRLQSREDIRDCVSETFSEFYLHRENYDPQKGALKSYLATIAHRCALRWQEDRFRQESAYQEPPPQRDPFADLEQQTELDAALAQLDPEDEHILRMKYYHGMSAREIAASLNLPYETVKKRHQRSLKKLRMILTAGLVLVLLAMLAACAVLVLRYFGIFVGYGVSTSTEEVAYLLPDAVTFHEGEYEIHVTDAWWRNGTLNLTLMVYGPETITDDLRDWSVEGLTDLERIWFSWGAVTAFQPCKVQQMYSCDLPEGTGETLELGLVCEGTSHPLTLTAVKPSDLEDMGSYSYTEDEGGLFAVPRLENGELVISIYPLNVGDFATQIGLCKMDSLSPPRPITATASDGTVLEGSMDVHEYISSHLYGTYLDWYFGPAEPGDYTLQIPYVYQQLAEPADISFDLPLSSAAEGMTLSAPGGTLTITSMVPVDGPLKQTQGELFLGEFPNHRWWELVGEWTPDNPERIPIIVDFYTPDQGWRGVDDPTYHGTLIQRINTPVVDDVTGETYYVNNTVRIGVDSGEDFLHLSLYPEHLRFRWERSFTLPITVEPETQWEHYTVTEGDWGVTASPRRLDTGDVVVSMWPVSGDEGLQISPAMSYLTMPITGAEEQPITLTDSNGTVFEGSFQMSRSGKFSNWRFGNIPAGEYTLHVPYLLAMEEPPFWYQYSLPLPKEGETLPGMTVNLGYGCYAKLGEATGLGPMKDYPVMMEDWKGDIVPKSIMAAGIQGAGSYSEDEPPFEVQLPIELQSGEEFTLLQAEVGIGVTMPNTVQEACVPQYDFSREAPLSGVLLRSKPGVRALLLQFWNPVYRWNHSFTFSVTIPE